MKARIFPSAIMAVTAVFTVFSCEVIRKPPELPSISLSQQTVTVNASGGAASIGYSISNPAGGLTVSAHASEEWVNSFDYDTDGTISFNVDENLSEERSCIVSVEYSDAWPATFIVQQKAAKAHSGYDFTLSYEVDGTAVTMSIVPSDNNIDYYFDVVAIGDLDSDSQEGMDAYCQEQFELIMSGYDKWGYSIEEAIADFCSRGEDSFIFADLEQETSYYGYAYAVAGDGSIASNVTYSPFETGKQSDIVIDIQVYDITASSATLDITPSNEDPYTYLITFADDFPEMTDEEIVMMLIDGLWLEPVTGPVSGDLVEGFIPATNYVVYAFGYQEGIVTSRIFKKVFTTEQESD